MTHASRHSGHPVLKHSFSGVLMVWGITGDFNFFFPGSECDQSRILRLNYSLINSLRELFSERLIYQFGIIYQRVYRWNKVSEVGG